MKKVKLPLFFKSHEYRKICTQYVISVIIVSIQTVWSLISQNCRKLIYVIAYSNKEKREEKIRAINKKRKDRELEQEKAMIYVFYKGAICSLDMCILSYLSNHRRKDLPIGYFEELHQQFNDAKKRIEYYGKELEKIGVELPDELKNRLGAVDKVEKFNYLGEYETFFTRTYNLLSELEI